MPIATLGPSQTGRRGGRAAAGLALSLWLAGCVGAGPAPTATQPAVVPIPPTATPNATATPPAPTPTATPAASATPPPTATPVPTATVAASPTAPPPTVAPPTPTAGIPEADAAAAAQVIRDYVAAINARDYRAAYAAWWDGGAASGQTYEAFAAGFARTRGVAVQLGEPGRIDAGAGQRYITIPVVVLAETTTGDSQRFVGTYTLRRTVVDGATEAQRRWHIASADIAETVSPR